MSRWYERHVHPCRGDGTRIIREDFNYLREDFEGTAMLTRDGAIGVEWHDRDLSDPDGKTFVSWDLRAAGNARDARVVLSSRNRVVNDQLRDA